MQFLKDRLYTYDGSKGTMFMLKGYNQFPESLNLTNPEVVYDLAETYAQLGCDFIQTNTFNANGISLKKYNLLDKQKELIEKSVDIAKKAASVNGNKVIFSIGPTGRLMEPSGDLSYIDAYNIFYTMEEYALDCGVDMFQFETFTDIYEIKIAVLALKDLCESKGVKVNILCSISFEENERTLMGNTPEQCAVLLTKLGVDVVGSNCGFGGDKMVSVISKMANCTNLPILAKPNAGLPKTVNGKTTYTQEPNEFAKDCVKLFNAGANIIGGCCGTTPEHIEEMQRLLKQEKQNTTLKQVNLPEITYENPAFLFPEEWDDDLIYDLAYDCLDNENDLICVYGEDGAELANAVRILYSVTKTDISVSSINSLVLEDAIKRAPILPDIWVESDNEVFSSLADKYNLNIIKKGNFQ